MFDLFGRDRSRLAPAMVLSDGLPLYVIDRCMITESLCLIDGKRYKPKVGAWTFYLPKLNLKVFHAVNGRVHCTHHSAPSREKVFNGEKYSVRDDYEAQDWMNVYSKPILRRVAENHIMYKRLHEYGIGPEVFGCCLIMSFNSNYLSEATYSGGVMVADLTKYKPRESTTEAQMVLAGVVPDRIRSAIRQQIKGYVSDLNSVVGAMPVEADAEVASLENELLEQLNRFRE